jgi:hypothetical protein
MRAIQFIFSHALFAAFCAVALCFETTSLLGLGHDAYLYAFVFFATLGSYNFHLLMGALYAEGSTLKVLLRRHTTAVGFMIVSAIVLLGLLPKLWHVWPYLLVAAVATAAYSLVLLPVAALAPLRRAGFAKTFLLALTWTFVTAFLPLQKNMGHLQTVEMVFILHRFLLILQICLLFDLRDTAIDKIKGLHSLATDMGPAAVQWLFYILAGAYLLVSGLLAAMLQQFGIAPAFLCVQAAVIALCQVPVQKRSYFYYYFLVDGIMLLSVLLSGLVLLLYHFDL